MIKPAKDWDRCDAADLPGPPKIRLPPPSGAPSPPNRAPIRHRLPLRCQFRLNTRLTEIPAERFLRKVQNYFDF